MSESVATGMRESAFKISGHSKMSDHGTVFRVGKAEIPHLLSSLREDFPLAKSVCSYYSARNPIPEFSSCIIDL